MSDRRGWCGRSRVVPFGFALVSVAASFFVAASFDAHAAAEPALDADIECSEATGPGRVRCSVEARARGASMAWIDVTIRHVGGGARPLRARLGPDDVAYRSADRARFEFALVAPHAGRGKIVAVTRALLCRKKRCLPVSTLATGDYVVADAPEDAGAP